MADVSIPTAAPLSHRRNVDLIHAGRWPISTGVWDASRDDLAAAVAALGCPAVRRPVLKLGHEQQGTGQPAVGWVDNMHLADSGYTLRGDYVGMPGWLGSRDRHGHSVLSSAYPDRSVEGTYDFRCQLGHTHPFVVTAVALLGVTPPGVGTLKSLQDVAELYGVTASADGAGTRVVAHLPGQHDQEEHGHRFVAGDVLGVAGRVGNLLGDGDVFAGSDRVDGVDGTAALVFLRDRDGEPSAVISTRRADTLGTWSIDDTDDGTAFLAGADDAAALAGGLDRLIVGLRRRPDQQRTVLINTPDWATIRLRASARDGEPGIDVLIASYKVDVDDRQYLKERAAERRTLARETEHDIREAVAEEDADSASVSSEDVEHRVQEGVHDALAEFDQQTAEAIADAEMRRQQHEVRYTLDQAAVLQDRLSRFAENEIQAQAPHGSAGLVIAAAEQKTGAMVALVPSVRDAERIAVDGGEDPDELHVTLAYLGMAADWDAEAREAVVARLRGLVEDALAPDYDLPLVGDAFAVSVFNPPGTQREDGYQRDTCIVLGVGGDDLDAVHDLVEDAVAAAAAEAGVAVPEQHRPWVPHITVAYTEKLGLVSELADRTGPVTFDRLRIAFAGHNTDIPLGATEDVSAAAGDDNQLKEYWTRGAGLKRWVASAHPWTTLYGLLRKHVGNERAKRMASEWFHLVFGYWPGDSRHRKRVAASTDWNEAKVNRDDAGRFAEKRGLADIIDDDSFGAYGGEIYLGLRNDGLIDLGIGTDEGDPVGRFTVDDAETVVDAMYAMYRLRDGDNSGDDGLIDDTVVETSHGDLYVGVSRRELPTEDGDTDEFPILTLGVPTAEHTEDEPDYHLIDLDPEDFDRVVNQLQGWHDTYEPDEVDSQALAGGRYDVALLADHTLRIADDGDYLNAPAVHLDHGPEMAAAIRRLLEVELPVAPADPDDPDVVDGEDITDDLGISLFEDGTFTLNLPDGRVKVSRAEVADLAEVLDRYADIDNGRRVAARRSTKMPNPSPAKVAGEVTTDDIRAAFHGFAPHSRWITEMRLEPLELIVADDTDGKRYRVPVTVEAGAVQFGDPIEVVIRYVEPDAEAVAASTSTVVYASRDESRPRSVVAHLPGKHDQSAHGRRTGSGSTGKGSSGSRTAPSGTDSAKTTSVKASEVRTRPGDYIGKTVRFTVKDRFGRDDKDKTYEGKLLDVRKPTGRFQSYPGTNLRIEGITGSVLVGDDVDIEVLPDPSQGTKRRVSAAPAPTARSVIPPNQEETMPLSTDVLQRLGLAEDADGDAVNAAVLAALDKADAPPVVTPEQIAASAAETADLTQTVALLQKQVEDMSAELAAAKAEKVAVVKASVLDDAVRHGKITPAEREQWESDYDAAPAAVTRVLASIATGTRVPVEVVGRNADPDAGDGSDSEFDRLFPPALVAAGKEG